MTMTNENEQTCPICLDPMTCHVLTSCGHHFHGECLLEHHVRNGFLCPCCRSPTVSEKDMADARRVINDVKFKMFCEWAKREAERIEREEATRRVVRRPPSLWKRVKTRVVRVWNSIGI